MYRGVIRDLRAYRDKPIFYEKIVRSECAAEVGKEIMFTELAIRNQPLALDQTGAANRDSGNPITFR